MTATRQRTHYTRTPPRVTSIRCRVEVQPVKVTTIDDRGRPEVFVVDVVEFGWDPTYESSPHTMTCWGHRPDVPLADRDDAPRVMVPWRRVTDGADRLRKACDDARHVARWDLTMGAALP